EQARHDRRTRQRRLRVLTVSTIALTGATIIILSAAVLWIRAARGRALAAEAQARGAEALAIAEKDRAEGAERTARAEKDRAEAAEREARAQKDHIETEYYLNSIALADRSLNEGDYANARRLLEGCAPRLRHWEWGWLARRSQRLLAEFEGHTARPGWIEFSPDGNQVLGSFGEFAARAWDTRSGKLLWTRGCTHPQAISFPACPRFSRDGRWVAIPANATLAMLYPAQDFKAEAARTLTIKGWIGYLAFSSDSARFLAITGQQARVWEVDSGNVLWEADRQNLSSVGALAPGGRHVALTAPPTQSGGLSGCTIAALDGSPAVTVSVAAQPEIMEFVDDQTLAVGLGNGTVQCLAVADGSLVKELAVDQVGITRLRLSPDGRRLLIGTYSGLVQVVRTADWTVELRLQAHATPITGIDLHPSGRLLLTAAQEVRLWPFAGMGGRGVVPYRRCNLGTVTDMAWHPAGQQLGMLTHGGPRLYDRRSGLSLPDTLRATTERWLQEHARIGLPTRQFAYSKDGRYAACAAGFRDSGQVLILDAATWELLACHPCWVFHDRTHASLARLFLDDPEQILVVPRFQPADGKPLKIGNDWEHLARPTVLRWRTGEAILSQDRGVLRAGVSLDGTQVVALLHGGVVELRDLSPEGSVRQRLGRRGGQTDVIAFSPDGAMLLIATFEEVTAWNTADGQRRYTFRGHRNAIVGMAFSPDGARIVTAAENDSARLWDAATGRGLLTFPIEEGYCTALCAVWSPDGQVLALGGVSSTHSLNLCETLPTDTPLDLGFARVRACLEPAP
ncbi:MAG: hypothetical protein GX595_19680, partial [Lentisphaerae bacterium]|nr:hypothetical protein [Lentisphaerota bacterium]